jgi:hypothetical protein
MAAVVTAAKAAPNRHACVNVLIDFMFPRWGPVRLHRSRLIRVFPCEPMTGRLLLACRCVNDRGISWAVSDIR